MVDSPAALSSGPIYPSQNENDVTDLGDLSTLLPEMNGNGVANRNGNGNGDPGHSWDRDWQDLWQNSGLDQGWIFSNIE